MARIRYDARVIDANGKVIAKKRFLAKDAAWNWLSDHLVRRRRVSIKRRVLADKLPDFMPTLVGWGVTGISPDNVFGSLGPETKVTTHYAASPRAKNLAEGIALTRSFDKYHASKGWGGLSYHYLIPDTGELILGRSTLHMGAHVALTNTGNVGVNFFCGPGHSPTAAQKRTYQWLMANAHTDKLPPRHRTDRDLRTADIRGHNQWPNQSTGCPGNFTPAKLSV